ncbi:hypothetical protein [Enterococcus sp. DIV0756]
MRVRLFAGLKVGSKVFGLEEQTQGKYSRIVCEAKIKLFFTVLEK